MTIASAVADIGMAMRELIERTLQPCHVAPLVDDAAVPDLADLVDAVGELIAAILDVDRGLPQRQVAAVHIGDA